MNQTQYVYLAEPEGLIAMEACTEESTGFRRMSLIIQEIPMETPQGSVSPISYKYVAQERVEDYDECICRVLLRPT